MNNREQAISLTKNFLEKDKFYHGYQVDEPNILEKESLWYVSFYDPNADPDEFLVGAYNGLLIDKFSNDHFQPGSALDLEEWMYGFSIGLRGGRYDLQIEKVYDLRGTVEILDKLGLSYVRPEKEGTRCTFFSLLL